MTSHTTPGSFLWYDLLSPEPALAIAFYTHVIGWSSRPMEGGHGYTLFVAAQGPLAGTVKTPEQAAPGALARWNANVHVADAVETAAKVRMLGGRVISEPAHFPGVGHIAVITDPQGAMITLYQPDKPRPVRDIEQAGEFVWNELATSDRDLAFAFYRQIFGWTKTREHDMGAMGKYSLYSHAAKELGGILTKPKEMPAATWMYYVRVDDLDAAVARAKEKEARLLNGPMQVPGGARIAQLSDPQGAVFALHEKAKS